MSGSLTDGGAGGDAEAAKAVWAQTFRGQNEKAGEIAAAAIVAHVASEDHTRPRGLHALTFGFAAPPAPSTSGLPGACVEDFEAYAGDNSALDLVWTRGTDTPGQTTLSNTAAHSGTWSVKCFFSGGITTRLQDVDLFDLLPTGWSTQPALSCWCKMPSLAALAAAGATRVQLFALESWEDAGGGFGSNVTYQKVRVRLLLGTAGDRLLTVEADSGVEVHSTAHYPDDGAWHHLALSALLDGDGGAVPRGHGRMDLALDGVSVACAAGIKVGTDDTSHSGEGARQGQINAYSLGPFVIAGTMSGPFDSSVVAYLDDVRFGPEPPVATGGSALTAPMTRGPQRLPAPGIIQNWHLDADVPCTAVLDVRMAAATQSDSEAASICGSSKPTLTAPQFENFSADLSGWTVVKIPPGARLFGVLESISAGVGRITLNLEDHNT